MTRKRTLLVGWLLVVGAAHLVLGPFIGGVLYYVGYAWAHDNRSWQRLSQLPSQVWLDNVFWLGFALFYIWCLHTFVRYVQDVWRSGKFFP